MNPIFSNWTSDNTIAQKTHFLTCSTRFRKPPNNNKHQPELIRTNQKRQNRKFPPKAHRMQIALAARRKKHANNQDYFRDRIDILQDAAIAKGISSSE